MRMNVDEIWRGQFLLVFKDLNFIVNIQLAADFVKIWKNNKEIKRMNILNELLFCPQRSTISCFFRLSKDEQGNYWWLIVNDTAIQQLISISSQSGACCLRAVSSQLKDNPKFITNLPTACLWTWDLRLFLHWEFLSGLINRSFLLWIYERCEKTCTK